MPSTRGPWACHDVAVHQAGAQAEVEVVALGVVAEVDPKTKCHSLMRTLYEPSVRQLFTATGLNYKNTGRFVINFSYR